MTFFIFSTHSLFLYSFMLCLASLQLLWSPIPNYILSVLYLSSLIESLVNIAHLFYLNIIHFINRSSNFFALTLTSLHFILSLWVCWFFYIQCLFSLHIIPILSDFLVTDLSSLLLIISTQLLFTFCSLYIWFLSFAIHLVCPYHSFLNLPLHPCIYATIITRLLFSC